MITKTENVLAYQSKENQNASKKKRDPYHLQNEKGIGWVANMAPVKLPIP